MGGTQKGEDRLEWERSEERQEKMRVYVLLELLKDIYSHQKNIFSFIKFSEHVEVVPKIFFKKNSQLERGRRHKSLFYPD